MQFDRGSFPDQCEYRHLGVKIMVRLFIATACLAIGCAGCAVLSSETLEQLNKDDRAPRGTYYALPKGIVTATLQVNQQDVAFTLTVDGPAYVPDLAHAYYLGYKAHPSYKDDIRITTTKEGLLTRVASSTTDQTPSRLASA